MIAAFTVSAASAIDPAEASTMATAIVRNGSSVKLFYKSAEASNVRVTIYNEESILVYAETVKQTDGFVRPYRFENLPYGDYRIVISNGRSRRVEHVNYSNKGVVHLASMVRMEEGKKYLLIVPNKSTERLLITVTNDKGVTLHTSTHELEGDFSTVLNVEDLDGHFTVSIMDSKGEAKSFSY